MASFSISFARPSKNLYRGGKVGASMFYGHISSLNIFFTDQRNLGMSMKIERSSLEQVRKRFEMNKRKLEEKKKDYDFEERIKELKEEVLYEILLV